MSDNAKPKSDQVELGALWKKQGQSQKFLSGELDLNSIGINKKVPVVIFTNKFKQKDTHPDYRVFLSKPKTQAGSAPAKAATAAQAAPAAEEEDPIL